MGTLLATGLVSDEVRDLYDYDELRCVTQAIMIVAHVARSTLVLGGSQSVSVVNESTLSGTPLCRRRGGGGLVLLRPADLWVDWWIPRDDPRWSGDVHVSSVRAGRWWAEQLVHLVTGDIEVYAGPLDGDARHRDVCFAGRGPGEVMVNGRKAVGVTQWRIREGTLVSTVLHASGTSEVANYLVTVPDGLHQRLDHQTLGTLDLGHGDGVLQGLGSDTGCWVRRTVFVSTID